MKRFNVHLEFVRNVFLNKCYWVLKAAVFLLRNLLILFPESCSLHIFWRGRLCSGRLFVAPQDTAALPACQGLFSTQISCPPARRADILALATCYTFQRSLWERLRGFAAVYSREEAGSPAGVGMVVVQSRLVLLWPETLASALWRDGVYESTSFFLCQAPFMSLFHCFSWGTFTPAWNAEFTQRISKLR